MRDLMPGDRRHEPNHCGMSPAQVQVAPLLPMSCSECWGAKAIVIDPRLLCAGCVVELSAAYDLIPVPRPG